LFVLFTGQTDETALVLSTLVLATTFTPIKSRLELVAARRFKSSGAELERTSGSAPAEDPELDARLEAAIRRAVADALRERDSAGRRGA